MSWHGNFPHCWPFVRECISHRQITPQRAKIVKIWIFAINLNWTNHGLTIALSVTWGAVTFMRSINPRTISWEATLKLLQYMMLPIALAGPRWREMWDDLKMYSKVIYMYKIHILKLYHVFIVYTAIDKMALPAISKWKTPNNTVTCITSNSFNGIW